MVSVAFLPPSMTGPPERKRYGMSKTCRPPSVETTRLYTTMGLMSGSVMCRKMSFCEAPSNCAASNTDGLMPRIPAESVIMLLPNHIQNWMKAMMMREGQGMR